VDTCLVAGTDVPCACRCSLKRTMQPRARCCRGVAARCAVCALVAGACLMHLVWLAACGAFLWLVPTARSCGSFVCPVHAAAVIGGVVAVGVAVLASLIVSLLDLLAHAQTSSAGSVQLTGSRAALAPALVCRAPQACCYCCCCRHRAVHVQQPTAMVLQTYPVQVHPSYAPAQQPLSGQLQHQQQWMPPPPRS
jgi:hypothetical protein